jgi:uncharacterized protein YkwD
VRNVVFILLIGLIASFGGWGYSPTDASPDVSIGFDDIEGHWAEDTILWGASKGIVQGYPDGSFHPGGSVTESQFLAMLLRAYPQIGLPANSGNRWYSDYYAKAAQMNWPLSLSNADRLAKRGSIAKVLAATQGEIRSIDDAVDFVLSQKLATGKGNGEFEADAHVTRAEAVQFVRNLVSGGYTLHEVKAGAGSTASSAGEEPAALRIAGIAIGDTEAKLLKALGTPQRKDASEYGFTWYVYNQDYRSFAMAGVSGGKVVALFGNGGNWSLGALNDSKRSAGEEPVLKLLGSPTEYIMKSNVRMMLNDGEERDTFVTKSSYITMFYDLHEGGAISGVQAVERETELSLKGFYNPSPSAALRQSFELQSLDLANSERVKRGLAPLRWDELIADTARKHSRDMAMNDFFEHDNPAGESPFDRMDRDGIAYITAGENIAAGQTNAIFAHEALMNSMEGHRDNILGDYERLGVGVAFAADDGAPYYTQNFYTPAK